MPVDWRPVLKEIVSSLVQGNFSISNEINHVRPVTDETATQMAEYLADYGENLVDLPEETWKSSVAQNVGPHWEVMVDLWTENEGRSDLVLLIHIIEHDQGAEFDVKMVYVP